MYNTLDIQIQAKKRSIWNKNLIHWNKWHILLHERYKIHVTYARILIQESEFSVFVCFGAKWFSISKWIILWAYSVFFFINNHIIIMLCNCYESEEHVFYRSHPNLNFNKTRHWRQNMFSLIYILPKNKVFRKQVLTLCITKSRPQ